MTITLDRAQENFEIGFEEFVSATPLTRADKASKLASQIDMMSQTPEGIKHLYERCIALEEAGIFENSPWISPEKQAPPLVKGTLLAGHPTSSFEILSELRILAYANGKAKSETFSAKDASNFLEEVLVHNLEFAFDELTEQSRSKLSERERKKVVNHFSFLIDNADLEGIKEKLAEEIKMVCAQRPIVTTSVRQLIELVHHKLELNDNDEVDQTLAFYVNAVYFPGKIAARHADMVAYRKVLESLSDEELRTEVREIAGYLHETGLTNPHLATALVYCLEHKPIFIPELLKLSDQGKSEWEKYQKYITKLCITVFGPLNFRGIYGLKRMLERNLFSRRAVRAGLTNLRLIHVNDKVAKRVIKSVSHSDESVDAIQYLLGAVLSILGQPIGIGQGNNATCQSARGISMWAQHSPAKLINMVTTVATANNFIMRFENQTLESNKIGKGLIDQLDHKLDAVSVVLVPHLDKIYNEMMRRAAGRGEDGHKWVNPALYGHWIPMGFASAYASLIDAVQDFDGFVRLFYAGFHPEYNGGREMVYPNPIGIFITSSRGDMLGFHAISLLRVAKVKETGEIRAYFLNPNNEGRQDWGQGIKPSVFGNGERHGESSLPMHQFTARVYAFHFNPLEAKPRMELIPNNTISEVRQLAEASWGKSYKWSDIKKQW